ncbi:MAG: DUF6036 family nucleotidyltransferase [Candidatus Dormibacteria bacterium]
MPEPLMGRQEMIDALRRVGEKVFRKGRRADVFVFGGAAMVMAYQARPSTRDVDAVFEPDDEVQAAALEVAEEMGLPRYWLNNQGSSYLSSVRGDMHPVLLDEPGIRVMGTSKELALAMKLGSARREQDLADIRWLLDQLGITTVDQARQIFLRFYPGEALKDRAVLLLEDVLTS